MRGWMGVLITATVGIVACRPSDVLRVPAPAGVLGSSAVKNQNGAEGAFEAGKTQLFSAMDGYFGGGTGLLNWSGLLTDEFTFTGISPFGYLANIDARSTQGGGGFLEYEDLSWQYLMQARSSLLAAIPGLVAYEPAARRSTVGEAYALAGYAELLVAESYCAGSPLDEVLPGGTIKYGTPLTSDSLLGAAQNHFDSAVAAANGDATVASLAGVGLGRTLLDRGQYAAARAAVQSVASAFLYNSTLEPDFKTGATQGPNLYTIGAMVSFYAFFNVADAEGENGLNFVSARDPRLVLDSSFTAADGSTWYLPLKFKAHPSDVPLATGIEARLVEAEAALAAHDVNAWLADLNSLRNSGCAVSGVDTTCSLGTGQVPGQTVGLPPLTDPGADSARVSLLFRERAFWLFGTGVRLGDLRRLIRQYGRNAERVFPTGPYAKASSSNLPAPIPNYGSDVNLTLPTPFGLSSNSLSEPNPSYEGCIASTKTA